MKKTDLQAAIEIAELIRDLTENEGDSVEICADNPCPDIGDAESCIVVIQDFGEPQQFFGDSVLDCLRNAKSHLLR